MYTKERRHCSLVYTAHVALKLAFYDADTDFLARILADSPYAPTSPRKILARMSVSVSASWNAGLTELN